MEKNIYFGEGQPGREGEERESKVREREGRDSKEREREWREREGKQGDLGQTEHRFTVRGKKSYNRCYLI